MIGEATKLTPRVILSLFISTNFFFLVAKLILAHNFLKVLVINPHLELIDIVGSSRDSQTMPFDNMSEIEVDIKNAACMEAYFCSL